MFPSQSVFTVQVNDTVEYSVKDADYTILMYLDTTGCASCRLNLAQWKKFIEETSLIDSVSVKYYFNFFSKDLKKMRRLLRTERFIYPVCLDTADVLNRLNDFPREDVFQTFLLDRNNRVLIIGNPMHNPAIKTLYLERITGRKSKEKELKTTVKINNAEINMGEVSLSSGMKSCLWGCLSIVGSAINASRQWQE